MYPPWISSGFEGFEDCPCEVEKSTVAAAQVEDAPGDGLSHCEVKDMDHVIDKDESRFW